jgi:hypothetical protein
MHVPQPRDINLPQVNQQLKNLQGLKKPFLDQAISRQPVTLMARL